MAFLRRLALFAFSSAAVASEDCHDGSCAAKAQQLLQKSKTQKAMKAGKVEHSNLGEYHVLENFVDLLALQQSPLTSEQMAIVSELNRTFYEQTLPTLFQRSENDKHLLRQHAQAVANCTMNLQSSATEVYGLKAESDAAAATFAHCNATEVDLRREYGQAVAVMTNFLTNTVPSCGSIPEPRQPTPEMDQWVMCNMAFYRSFNTSYYSYKATAVAAESAYNLMSNNCSALSGTAFTKYCDWAVDVGLTKAGFEQCHSETTHLFHETLDSARSNAEGRMTDYTALVKIECYLGVLMSQDISAAGEIHTRCDNVEVNTQQFYIMAPELAPYPTELVNSLGSPDASTC